VPPVILSGAKDLSFGVQQPWRGAIWLSSIS